MAKQNILVVPPFNTNGGVGFFRSIQPHIQLEKQFPEEFSVTIDGKPEWDNIDSFKKYDLIHIHISRAIGDAKFVSVIEKLKELGIVLVTDIDDYWKLDFRHPQFAGSKFNHMENEVKGLLKRFDYVTTTTPIFAKEIKTYNKNVVVLENAINPEDKEFQVNKEPSDRLRIGFVMGSTHEKDMEIIGKISESLTKEELDKVQFVLCGFDTRGVIREILPNGQVREKSIDPDNSVWSRYERIVTSDYKIITPEHKAFLKQYLPNIEYPNYKNSSYRRCWTRSMSEYFQHYNNIDILLVPLETSDFNRVKSPLKVVECAFSHTGIVASEFGPYTLDLKSAFQKGGTIDPNGNSLLVEPSKNRKNWLRFIKMLIANPKLVKQLQDNLYNDVHEKYDLRNVTVKRYNEYKKMIENKTK